MEENKIELRVNEEKTIQLPSRGSSGLRIIFTVSDSSVASVSRKELQSSDIDQLDIKPGDKVPAFFIIKGIKSGTASLHFSERKPGADAGPDIPLKDFEVQVNE
jgi:hypothetical protein